MQKYQYAELSSTQVASERLIYKLQQARRTSRYYNILLCWVREVVTIKFDVATRSSTRRLPVSTAYPCSMAEAAINRSLNGSVFPFAAYCPSIWPASHAVCLVAGWTGTRLTSSSMYSRRRWAPSGVFAR